MLFVRGCSHHKTQPQKVTHYTANGTKTELVWNLALKPLLDRKLGFWPNENVCGQHLLSTENFCFLSDKQKHQPPPTDFGVLMKSQIFPWEHKNPFFQPVPDKDHGPHFLRNPAWALLELSRKSGLYLGAWMGNELLKICPQLWVLSPWESNPGSYFFIKIFLSPPWVGHEPLGMSSLQIYRNLS